MALVKQPEADIDEELTAQLAMLPDADEVCSVVSQLEPGDLREFAAAIMNVATDHAQKRTTDMETVRLLNGWFASTEETIAAGDYMEEILSRRRSLQVRAGRRL